MKICPLCNKNLASKTNCHIYPRFFGDTMKRYKGLSRVSNLNESNLLGQVTYRQDTAKEDYLLCPQCEAFLANELETHVADNFYNLRHDVNNYFKTRINNELYFKTFYKLDYQIFKRLAFSMLFRANLATVKPFGDFKIEDSILEGHIGEMILKKSAFEDIPMYVFLQPQTNARFPNIMSIRFFNKNPYAYHLIVNELMIIMDFSKNDIELRNNFSNYLTQNDNKIRFFEPTEIQWTNWILFIMSKSQSQIVKDKLGEIISWLIKRKTN